MNQYPDACKYQRCTECPYPYCIEEDPEAKAEFNKVINPGKLDPKEKKREIWRRWYMRNRKKEQARGLTNYYKRKKV